MLRKSPIIFTIALISLAGCTAYRNFVRESARKMGAIQIRDIWEANSIRDELPTYLDLAADQVRVSPDAKDTDVAIIEVADEQKDEIRRRIEEYRSSRYFTYESEPDRKVPMKPITVTFRRAK